MTEMIPLENIEINEEIQSRHRNVGENLEDLVDSIRDVGLLDSITVRPSSENEDKYEIIAGQRRYLAHKELEKDKIKANVKDLNDAQALKVSLTENIERENISIHDKADSVDRLQAFYGYDSWEKVADELKKSTVTIRRWAALKILPKSVIDMVDAGQITQVDARKIAQYTEGFDEQRFKERALWIARNKNRKEEAFKIMERHPVGPISKLKEELSEIPERTEVNVRLTKNTLNELKGTAKEEGVSGTDNQIQWAITQFLGDQD